MYARASWAFLGRATYKKIRGYDAFKESWIKPSKKYHFSGHLQKYCYFGAARSADGPLIWEISVFVRQLGEILMASNFTRVRAIHPYWNGFLRLSNTDNIVIHEGHYSTGTYDISSEKLTIFWHKYNPETFFLIQGVYVHETIVSDAPNLEQILVFRFKEGKVLASKISVVLPESNYEVTLRLQTSDIPTFNQVFGSYEYESTNLPSTVDTIVDLGANIGLATVFFGLKYPKARILAVEPEPHNFAAMIANTQALGTRVQTLSAAVWTNDGNVSLDTESKDGSSLGAWGVQVSEITKKSCKTTKCYKLETLLDIAGFSAVDILKVDIEGAELEVFSKNASKWLDRVKMIIVETHDRFRPGSDDAVRKAVSQMFEELPRSGENLFFRRNPDFVESYIHHSNEFKDLQQLDNSETVKSTYWSELFLINLDRNVERLQEFQRRNSHLTGLIKRFSAIDGGRLDRANLTATGYLTAESTYSPGALGCAMSHISLWEMSVRDNKVLTVAEDDAIISRHFNRKATEILNSLQPDWDIVMWGWNFDAFLWIDLIPGVSPARLNCYEDQLRQNIDEFQELATSPMPIRLRHLFGTMCYSVSPKGAQALLDSILPIHGHIVDFKGFDVQIQNEGIDRAMNEVFPALQSFVCVPPLAASENHKDKSTIVGSG
jgi:FkbM family methyltransferase